MAYLDNEEQDMVVRALAALEKHVERRHRSIRRILADMPNGLRESVDVAFAIEQERIFDLGHKVAPSTVDAPEQSVGAYCRNLTGAEV